MLYGFQAHLHPSHGGYPVTLWVDCPPKCGFQKKMRIHPLHPTTIVLTPLLANSSLRELPNDMSLTESSVCLKPSQFAMCVILCSADWQFQPSNK